MHYFLAQFLITHLGLKATDLTYLTYHLQQQKAPRGYMTLKWAKPQQHYTFYSLFSNLHTTSCYDGSVVYVSKLQMTSTFVQVWTGFGLVTEALTASVATSTDHGSWRDVTASSGNPGCGPRKSDGEREIEKKKDRKNKQATALRLFTTVTKGQMILD